MLKTGDLAVINKRAQTKILHGMIVKITGKIPSYEDRNVNFLFVDIKDSDHHQVGENGSLELYKLSPFTYSNRAACPVVLKQD